MEKAGQPEVLTAEVLTGTTPEYRDSKFRLWRQALLQAPGGGRGVWSRTAALRRAARQMMGASSGENLRGQSQLPGTGPTWIRKNLGCTALGAPSSQGMWVYLPGLGKWLEITWSLNLAYWP